MSLCAQSSVDRGGTAGRCGFAAAAALFTVVFTILFTVVWTPTSARADPVPSTQPPSHGGQSSSTGTGSANGGQPATSGVSVTLTSMTPRSPAPRPYDAKVTFSAIISNNSNTSYSDLAVGLERGAPLGQQRQLDQAIATPPPTNSLLSSNDVDEHRALPPHQSISVSYRTVVGADGMCLCNTGVYPYALVVRAVNDLSVGFQEVGRTQIFVPSFQEATQPVTVSWIWPLLDRPHRGLSDTVFNDDQLTSEVAAGGRLDRALTAAELTAGKVRMLLMVDPDLLDSLTVMASPAGYQYRHGNTILKGTGGLAAAAWLARFKAIEPFEDVVLTAYADPDINAVTRAGMSWSTALDPQVQSRLAPTLSNFSSDVIWPAGGVLTSRGLDAAVGGGSAAAVLSDAALPGQNKTQPRPNALSPLPSAAGRARALVTDTAIERTVNQILKLGAIPAQAQQTLLAQLAIRAVQDESSSHYVVITPDRYVDTSPQVAAQTILVTVDTPWSKAISVRTALSTVTPVDRGPLNTPAADPSLTLRESDMTNLARVQTEVSSLREALNSAAAADLLGGFAAGIQRAQSSAWQRHLAGGAAATAELNVSISRDLNSIYLVKPSTGTYSLSSASAPVVLTVQNDLNRDVSVRVSVTPANGVIGFHAPPIDVQVIPARNRKTISIPTHVERLGKFQVRATLTTPDGRALGNPIQLNLRATAIGGITKTITIVAAVVLIIALLRRLVRRIRRGPAPSALAQPPPAPPGPPAPAAAT